MIVQVQSALCMRLRPFDRTVVQIEGDARSLTSLSALLLGAAAIAVERQCVSSIEIEILSTIDKNRMIVKSIHETLSATSEGYDLLLTGSIRTLKNFALLIDQFVRDEMNSPQQDSHIHLDPTIDCEFMSLVSCEIIVFITQRNTADC